MMTNTTKEIMNMESMIKIDFISDTHCKYKLFDLLRKSDAELVVHCGDFCVTGTKESEVYGFLTQMESLPHPTKFVGIGNHDGIIQLDPTKWKKIFAEKGITLLIEEEIMWKGYKFYFMGRTQEYNNWFWAYDYIGHARELFEAVPKDTDFLINHGAPFGIMDENHYRHQLGCPELLRIVQINEPMYQVNGHVHGNTGTKIIGKTTHINCAQILIQAWIGGINET